MKLRFHLLLFPLIFLNPEESLAFTLSKGKTNDWRPDTVSVEEMARHFQEWADDIPYRPEATLDRLLTNKMRAFLVYEADADGGRDAFFMDSPKLEELASGGAESGLPPSYWRPLRDEQDTSKVYLQWYNSRPDYARGIDRKALARTMNNRTDKGVATWFTGPICLTARSRSYCHNQVAQYAKVFEVKQGEIVGGPYTLEEQRGLYSDSTANRRHIGITYWEELYGKDELALFANELKQQIGADTTRLFESGFDYTFLLTTDARGKAHLHLLWSTLTGKQLEVDADSLAKAPEWVRQFFAKSKTDVTRLTQAVEALPAGRFGHFITTDGRIFPGRYLRFCYDFLSKRFTVTDYLFDARRPRTICSTPGAPYRQVRTSPNRPANASPGRERAF